MSVRPLYIPAPYQDAADHGTLILRDGSTARLRHATPADLRTLRESRPELSVESLADRFFREGRDGLDDPESLAGRPDSRTHLVLVVSRDDPDGEHIMATGLYVRRGDETAEVGFLVEEPSRRRGIGQLMLERLSVVAVAHGIRTFQAVTTVEGRPMLEVFRHSGFTTRESRADDQVEIDFCVEPNPESIHESEVRDRTFTAASLEPLFKPRAVAVIGASRKEGSIGARILERLVTARFEGPVYPINPRARSIGAIPCYPSLDALPHPADLAVVAVPTPAVLDAVEDCARAGVKAVVVVSAGFAEVGEEGQRLQAALSERIRGLAMRMVGPNCLGVINPHADVRLNASFSPIYPDPGRVAMATQSGALGLAILDRARQIGLGLSSFVSIGNKADVSGNDLLQYWEEDPDTDLILLYQESLGNPRRFSRIARRICRKKPILCVKGGRSAAGERAASSHTAALAGRRDAADALYGQAGVLRVDTLSEMFQLAQTLANQPLPPGNRVAILTNAGGPAILCADMCEDARLEVQPLPDLLRERIQEILPAAASTTNPVDMIASANAAQYEAVSQLLLEDDAVDSLVVIHVPVHPDDRQRVGDAVARGVAAARATGATRKPVLFCAMGYEGEDRPLVAGSETIPTYVDPEVPARVLGRVLDYARWRRDPPGVFLDFDDVDPRGAREHVAALGSDRWLTWAEAETLFGFFGIRVVPAALATHADEAAGAATATGFPVTLKVQTRGLSHKSDRGGVALNLADEAAVREAYARIMDRFSDDGDDVLGVLVQPMVSDAVEVMVGAVEDPQFGALMTFGLGGVHVELLRDVSFRVTPLTDQDARTMIQDLKGRRLLEGYRGHPPADIAALEELLLRVSRMLEVVPEIAELDLNPVMALPPGEGYALVDLRIKLR